MTWAVALAVLGIAVVVGAAWLLGRPRSTERLAGLGALEDDDAPPTRGRHLGVPTGFATQVRGYRMDQVDAVLDSLEAGRAPAETFYDGYVVNAIMDTAYRAAASKRWEKVQLDVWRGREGVPHVAAVRDFDADHALLKEETMPVVTDGPPVNDTLSMTSG